MINEDVDQDSKMENKIKTANIAETTSNTTFEHHKIENVEQKDEVVISKF